MKTEAAHIKKAIRDIEKLEVDLQKLGMRSTPDIVGFYGELLVWKELKSHFGWKGYNIELGSGQSKADIQMTKKGNTIRIEVKTSRRKEEWYGKGYGAALNIKKCKNKNHLKRFVMHQKRGRLYGDFCYFDYLVFVKLEEDLKNAKYYIFSKNYLWNNEKKLRNKNKRFTNSTHRIIFIDEEKKTPEISKIDQYHSKQESKFQNKWGTIK